MTRSFIRTLLTPALLAVAIAPLALSASAAPGGEGKQQGWSEEHRQQHEQRRQALFERAGIDEETRQALEEARSEHYEAVRELREEHRQRVDEILGEGQREALEAARQEIREEQRAEHREAMQQRLTELVDSWELSDEEREALREAREAIYADMQALRERDFDSRQERHEAMRELREEHHEALAEILSDEQIEEMRSVLSRHGKRGDGRKDKGDGAAD